MSCNFRPSLSNPSKRENKMFHTSIYYLLLSSTLGTSPKKCFQKVRIKKLAPRASKMLQNFFLRLKKLQILQNLYLRLVTNDYILRNLILRFRAKTAKINSAIIDFAIIYALKVLLNLFHENIKNVVSLYFRCYIEFSTFGEKIEKLTLKVKIRYTRYDVQSKYS